MDGYLHDARQKSIMSCLPCWVPTDTHLTANAGVRTKAILFQCPCSPTRKIKVKVSLNDDEPAVIGAAFAKSKQLLKHAVCFKFAGGCRIIRCAAVLSCVVDVEWFVAAGVDTTAGQGHTAPLLEGPPAKKSKRTASQDSAALTKANLDMSKLKKEVPPCVPDHNGRCF